MPHTLSLVPTEDDEVDLTCTEGGHDWARRVSTPGDVAGAVSAHDEDVRKHAVAGFYLTPGLHPVLYRRDAEGGWWRASTWQHDTPVDVAALEFVGAGSEQ